MWLQTHRNKNGCFGSCWLHKLSTVGFHEEKKLGSDITDGKWQELTSQRIWGRWLCDAHISTASRCLLGLSSYLGSTPHQLCDSELVT